MCHDVFFFQAEDGIRDLVRSRGVGDVYKRQPQHRLRAVAERQRLAPRLADRVVEVGAAATVARLSLIHI